MKLKEMAQETFAPVMETDGDLSVTKNAELEDGRRVRLHAVSQVIDGKPKKIYQVKDVTSERARRSDRYRGQRFFTPLSADNALSEHYETFLSLADKLFGLDTVIEEQRADIIGTETGKEDVAC